MGSGVELIDAYIVQALLCRICNLPSDNPFGCELFPQSIYSGVIVLTNFLRGPDLGVLVVQGHVFDALSHSVHTELWERPVCECVKIEAVPVFHFRSRQHLCNLVRQQRAGEILFPLGSGSVYPCPWFRLSNGEDAIGQVSQNNAQGFRTARDRSTRAPSQNHQEIRGFGLVFEERCDKEVADQRSHRLAFFDLSNERSVSLGVQNLGHTLGKNVVVFVLVFPIVLASLGGLSDPVGDGGFGVGSQQAGWLVHAAALGTVCRRLFFRGQRCFVVRLTLSTGGSIPPSRRNGAPRFVTPIVGDYFRGHCLGQLEGWSFLAVLKQNQLSLRGCEICFVSQLCLADGPRVGAHHHGVVTGCVVCFRFLLLVGRGGRSEVPNAELPAQGRLHNRSWKFWSVVLPQQDPGGIFDQGVVGDHVELFDVFVFVVAGTNVP
mmetsp:Transcript_9055/g.26870  ORF Transcript_9055/g.26870 Transcript_9055/m.26870 type:complete len:433 (+) Transcript_9055:3509-4807(+)